MKKGETMKLTKNEKGAAGLEFTLAFPFLLFVCFGIVEFGALMFDKAIITNAAREGARAAVSYSYQGTEDPTCADLTEIQGIAQMAVLKYLDESDIDFDDPDGDEILADDIPVSIELTNGNYTVRVRVPYQYDFLFIGDIINALFNGAVGDSMQLVEAEAEMLGMSTFRSNDTPLFKFLHDLDCTKTDDPKDERKQ
jgi:hypothetical protein